MDQQIRVLVVDDDEPHAEAVAESLERVGYECVVATSGREGLRLIEEQTFDIVITDLIMDGVGGLEVLAKAKRELPDAEVVILTGHSTIKTAVTAMQAGATTYLTKPLDSLDARREPRLLPRRRGRRARRETQRAVRPRERVVDRLRHHRAGARRRQTRHPGSALRATHGTRRCCAAARNVDDLHHRDLEITEIFSPCSLNYYF